MLLVFKRFLFGPIREVLASRSEEIANTYAAADQTKSAAETLLKDYETRMAGVEAEAHAKIQAAIKEAQGMRDEIITDSRTKAESIIQRGQDELSRERDKTLLALRQEVADLVVDASSKLLDQSLDDAAHRKLIDDFISNVGTAK